jgi:hypothetical protein
LRRERKLQRNDKKREKIWLTTKKKINLNIDEFILEMRVNSGDFAHYYVRKC